MMASCVGAHHSFCTLKIGKKERCVRGDVDRKSNPANPAERSRNHEECERNASSLVETKKKATNRKTYHLRHDEIVLSPRVRGFQSVLGYSLLVFVKKRRNAFFLMKLKMCCFGGEFCLNKIGKLEIHLHFQSTLR